MRERSPGRATMGESVNAGSGRVAGLLRLARGEWRDPRRRISYVLMLNTGVMSILGLAYWAVVGRFVDAATLGVGASILGVASLVNIAARVGLDTTLLRHLGEAGTDRRRLLRVSCGVVAALTVLLALAYLAYLALADPAGAGEGIVAPGSAALFAVALASLSVGFLLDSALLASGRHVDLLAKNLAYSLLKIPLSLALVGPMGAAGLAVGWGAAMLLSSLPAAWLLWREARAQPGARMPPLVRGGDAAADYAVNVLLLGPGLLLPAVVLHVAGPDEAAYVYMAWMLANLAFVVPTAIGQAQLVGHAGGREESHGRPVALGALAAAAMALGAPVFLLLLGDRAYLSEAYPVFLVLVAATPLLAVEHLTLSRHRAAKRHAPALLMGLAQCAVLLAAVAWARPAGGLAVMALVWVGGHAAVAAWCLFGPRVRAAPAPASDPSLSEASE